MKGSPNSGVRKRRAVANLVGHRFGRLVVTAMSGYDCRNSVRWTCQCDCGGSTISRTDRLKSGRAQSCGCITNERMSALGSSHRTHGLCGGSLYRIWALMVDRCTNPKSHAYKYYGQRGIAPCAAIRQSAERIISTIGPRPHRLTLDRINNNGGYTCGACEECVTHGRPLNIRWATRTQQARNKSNTTFIQDGDKRVCLSEWCENRNLNRKTIYARIKRGWPIERLAESIL